MGDPFRGTEEAEDVRHDTMPRFNQRSVLDTAQKIIDSAPPGLTFKADNGATFLDIGRSFEASVDGEILTRMSTLDLRIILAHLDSAAHAVQHELARRGHA